MSAGQVIAGAVVSRTITWNEHERELFAASVAVALTVVVPNGKRLPDDGFTVRLGERSQPSFAVTE